MGRAAGREVQALRQHRHRRHPLEGAHGAALEIGYLLPSSGYVPGHHSGAAPLEDLISDRALSDRARAMPGEDLSASQVLAALDDAAGPGPRAAALHQPARRFADPWCRAVTNLAITPDPDVISVGGVSSSDVVFLPPLRSTLDQDVPYSPTLVVSRTPNDLSMPGALLLACRSTGVRVSAVSLPTDRIAAARAAPVPVAHTSRPRARARRPRTSRAQRRLPPHVRDLRSSRPGRP